MNLKKVNVFQTDDGKTFTEKLPAIEHGFELEIRSIFNQSNNGRSDNYSSSQIANVLNTKLGEVQKVIKNFNRAKGQLKKAI